MLTSQGLPFLSLVLMYFGLANAITDCMDKADIVFLVDSSLSIRENNPRDKSYDNWNLVKEFISQLVSNLPVSEDGIRVGVVPFSNEVNMEEVIYLDNNLHKYDLEDRIMDLSFMGTNTNTSGALNTMTNAMFAEDRGDREGVSNIGFLVTDGLSNVDDHLTINEARQAKNTDIRLFSLGISKYADTGELEEIASDPVSYYYFLAHDFQHLALLQDQVISRLCRAKPPPPTPCKDARGDLVLILDDSGSIMEKNPPNTTGNYNWELLLQFTVEIIESLDIGMDSTRLAVIRFSQYAEVMFHLNTYSTAEEMTEHVRGLDYLSGGTNTSGALRVMRREVFRPEKGDREDVRNVGIIITDGESTIAENETIPEARLVKDSRIRMFAVGLTDTISEEELTEIASAPTTEHFFNRTEISEVDTLISRLVWSVCHDPCDESVENGTLIKGYGTVCQRHEDEMVCRRGEKLEWKKFPNHLLIGHNYARLMHVGSASDCQMACLQDRSCRSVDYVRTTQECSVSYVTKDMAPLAFAEDENVDYYHWLCEPDPASGELLPGGSPGGSGGTSGSGGSGSSGSGSSGSGGTSSSGGKSGTDNDATKPTKKSKSSSVTLQSSFILFSSALGMAFSSVYFNIMFNI